jgi:hypothetical protein
VSRKPEVVFPSTNTSFDNASQNNPLVEVEEEEDEMTRQFQNMGIATSSDNPFRNQQSTMPTSGYAQSNSAQNPFLSYNLASYTQRSNTPYIGDSAYSAYAANYQPTHGSTSSAGYLAPPAANLGYANQTPGRHKRSQTPAVGGYSQAQQHGGSIRRPQSAQANLEQSSVSSSKRQAV